ncbi:anti-sigma regulatory factor (Ser/Thr protein kinase) [Ruminiclostridium sufflavum DSM 19573]|uniref:Anti-sigma regulatory factor (Ser/Thr protein kinase) n=1 Tax=Ruminiclostridium sufflavum DSM 19573 TaxID=1121337 RepID=A0A318Y0F6_9FIRM|nr:ATP-binding protein [Ruminiclostridium sufflavum]PYG88794.1 anti-sigma regulatory factor (Ser/Thr protein kinase) [Ruminiclostridium sufflavum DSM 19573]
MGTIRLKYDIPANDFITAGEASSNVKNKLTQIGLSSDIIKKAAIAMYEAEINAVIHGNGGYAYVEISDYKVVINIVDFGPGIPDLDLAMQEGYSTAPDNIREMGFGAGMGLPNMKKYADKLEVFTKVGKGTKIIITVNF